jgi:2-keto-4-pentenoate hydratase/2-oxohepta-3-ene-1,7-dioic acid hydratase in catechol pathway
VRICRVASGENVTFAVVDQLNEQGEIGTESVILPIHGHPFGEFDLVGAALPATEVKLLAPVLPSKIICVGKNYADHAAEMGGDLPQEPLLFLKPSTSVIGPGDVIVLPEQAKLVHHEAELAIVIGRFCKDVPLSRVPEVILGYTCANDVTARDLQKSDVQWTRSKSFDTFCPLGPWIETDFDPRDREVTCYVGNELRQSGNTRDLVFDIPTLVSYISSQMTLLPGDVILTGTPAGVGPLVAGDQFDIEIEGIGSLVNSVGVAT